LKKELGDNYYSVRHLDKVASSSTDADAPMDDIRQSTPPASYDLLEQTSIDQSNDSNSDNYKPYDPTDDYDDTPPPDNELIDEEIELVDSQSTSQQENIERKTQISFDKFNYGTTIYGNKVPTSQKATESWNNKR
jgi:hypothetical protein